MSMFDSNALRDLATQKADRYQRAGGGGAFTVYNSAKAYDDSRGYREMSTWRRAVYEANQLWKSESRSAVAGFRWDCVWYGLDKDGSGDVPF